MPLNLKAYRQVITKDNIENEGADFLDETFDTADDSDVNNILKRYHAI